MEINRHNYESFALDYLEGRLTPMEMVSFMAFLMENTDIAAEIEILREKFNSISSVPESINFSFLKKDISQKAIEAKNFDEFCIAWHEGDLEPEYCKEINEFIGTDSTKRKLFHDYGKLKLQPDNSIIFQGKYSLKKHRIIIPSRKTFLITSLSVAASVAIFFIFNNIDDHKNLERVSKNTVSIENGVTSNKSFNSKNPKIAKADNFKKIKPLQKLGTPSIEVITNTDIVDTNNLPIISSIEIVRIESNSIELNPSPSEVDKVIAFSKPNVVKSKIEPVLIEKIRLKGTDLYSKANNLTIKDLVSTGINGINQMAETNLKFQSKSDKNGNIVEFALSSDNFNFRRKIGHN